MAHRWHFLRQLIRSSAATAVLAGILTLTLQVSTLQAQGSVRGTVVDGQSGAPIAGALVSVTGTPSHVTTTDSGTFVLASSAMITSITVVRVGYAGRTVTVTDASAPLRIALTGAPTELPGIQVTATRPEPSTAEITRNDLDRTSGLSIIDALNTVPGVFMQTRTPFGAAHIDIRGYYPSVSGNSPNSNGMGADVFLNGIPITDASGTTVLDDVDFARLGDVQIIKGPASSMFGSAIGGTVLMTTARPEPDQTSLSQQLVGGGNGLLRSTTSLQGANGASDYVLDYGYQTYNSWRPHSQSQKQYATATGDFQAGAKQSLTTYFSYNKSYEELAGEIDSTDFYSRKPVSDANYLANNSHIQLTSFFTGVGDTYHINAHFDNETSVFGSGRFANQPFAHGYTDATDFNFGARSVLGYTARTSSMDVHGTVGTMVQRSNVTSNGVFIVPAPPFAERPSASENYAVNWYAFTEWKFSFHSGMSVEAGASLINDAFAVQNLLKNSLLFDTTSVERKSFGWLFAPRIEAQQRFGHAALLYASVSTGYTPPLLTNVVASDGTIDTGLKPEHAVQYEVGAQGTIAGHLSGQVALFDLDNTNKLVSQTVTSVTSTTNVGEQRNEGAELSASWLALSKPGAMLSMVRPWASYTYTNAKYISFKSDNNNTATTVDFSGNYAARVPKDRYALGIDAATRNGFSLNGTYQYVDRVPVTFDNSTWVHSYSLLGAKLGYTTRVHDMWQLNVAVGGDNLTGNTYYTFLFVGPNYKGLAQGPDGGTGDGYILPGNPSAQLYASLGLTYLFK
ncbi:MAG TPA: TonB-dependent receptor [Gemmatimonadales bacterium]|nr:TonB-dependent receptor [Gemmatimonadales bacterium]